MWQARKDFIYLLGTGEHRQVEVAFSLSTTLVMQLGQDDAIVSAEVSSRGGCFDVIANPIG